MKGRWIREVSEEAEAPIVVVFVHGLLSDGEGCWLHQNGTYWPDLLSTHENAGHVGIYEFTYQTDFFSGSYNLGNVVDVLKECLHLDGVIQARKLVFVAHSMGGIIVRRYLVQRCDELVERGVELGLFLIASPSLGSPYANWLSPIAKLMGHSQGQVLTFCQSNHWLNDLNGDFRNLLARGKAIVYGRELVEDQFIAFKRFRWFTQVVPPFTGNAFFGESIKIPRSDHFSISKPENNNALQHRLLCDFIEKLTQQVGNASNVWQCQKGYRASVGESEIRIVTGRIEEYPAGSETVVVLPCNEYFEDQCTGDRRTALGVYVNKHCHENMSEFSGLVAQHCKSRFGVGMQQKKTSDESGESFGPGRAILIPDPSQHAAGLALISTTTQRAGYGLEGKMSYVFDGVRELFELLADKRINSVVMPVLGAGHGGIDPHLALSGLVVALAEAASQRRMRIAIVLFHDRRPDARNVSVEYARKVLELVANKP